MSREIHDVVYRAETMINTIDYARSARCSPAYPDDTYRRMITDLLAAARQPIPPRHEHVTVPLPASANGDGDSWLVDGVLIDSDADGVSISEGRWALGGWPPEKTRRIAAALLAAADHREQAELLARRGAVRGHRIVEATDD